MNLKAQDHELTMLRPVDVSAMLGVKVQSVYLLISEGHIPHVRIGRRLFIPVESWNAWLAEQNRRAQDRGIAEPHDKGMEVTNSTS